MKALPPVVKKGLVALIVLAVYEFGVSPNLGKAAAKVKGSK